jgi:predicted nucleic acid-binding protein
MLVLLDTGILLRLLDRADPQHSDIRQALRTLQARGEDLVTSPQNVAEFWNVCTCPEAALASRCRKQIAASGSSSGSSGYFPIARPPTRFGGSWWCNTGVQGVQVHDARLVAWMQVHGMTHLLTLNASDFSRYPSINAWTPQDVQALPPPP